MYNLIRKIHLYCGLIILIFLMMYFVSGFMMTHRPWFLGARAVPTTRTAVLESSGDQSSDQSSDPSKEKLAASVQRQLRLAGRIQFPQNQPPDVTRFWINHPGTEIRVDVSTGEKRIVITTQRERWVGILIMLHKVNAYDDDPVFDVYAFFCDLAGLSMILFALSGVYLWWKSTRNHAWGILCVAASCAYGAGMMLYLAYAP
jgi:hypothetical protein